MESLFQYVSPPGPCGYLPGETWQYENEYVAALTAAEYEERMRQGWRRFGRLLFRPRCPACTACRSLRVDVAHFRPDRSQRRNRKLNDGVVTRTVADPEVTRETLDLYDRYHAYQSDAKGWPGHAPKDVGEYFEAFVDHPFPTEEWRYWLGDRLVGVGYIDRLPTALSAIYFFYDPGERHRGLGTWNVLRVIDRAAQLGIPYVYLGYHIADSPSLAYKANFAPNQTLRPDGAWSDFRP
jgi:arginine-tRNA-protein transferase